MRVLLAHHFPFDLSGDGRYSRDLGCALVAAGHAVHGLIVDRQPQGDDAFPVRRVVCRSDGAGAPLAFEPPCFATQPLTEQTFETLSISQLVEYRGALRAALDREVDTFDPHLIHAPQIWIFGQLALETGVPYVLSAWGPDLASCAHDPRYRVWAEQAAENAGEIFIPGSWLREPIAALFDGVIDRTTVMPPAVEARRLSSDHPPRQATLARLGLPADTGPIVACVFEHLDTCGVELLLNAATRYEPVLANVATVLVVAGPMRGQFEAQLHRLGLARTQLLWDLPEADRHALQRLAEVAVVPGSGAAAVQSALEIQALGTPVIAMGGSSMENFVNDQVGQLLEQADHELLAEAIQDSVRGQWKTRKGPQAALDVRQKHAIDGVAEQMATTYRRVYCDRCGRMPD